MRCFRSCHAVVSLLLAIPAHAQNQQQMPRDYRGVETIVPGIFVTPVPNAPFTATIEILSHENLPDGTVNTRTTTAHIARASSGRIYNERRQLVPTSFKGEPQLLSAHIYDPSSRLNIFYNPFQHIARESIYTGPPAPPPNTTPARTPVNNPYFKQEDIGTQPLDGLTLTGIRKTHIIPAAMSTTGKDVAIVDEYWYSPELSIYMIIKHNDPRTGEQLVAVGNVERHEPAASIFVIPANYKIVDENPPEIDSSPQPAEPMPVQK
ncbi:hypothetical protein RBB79_12025 [Tunturiibacter empetritectus]|uniref:TIGR03749 family integrating conjugative element protein n=1 Tax=Tunturiibacter lichenicola TaxID=2051959 RepID=A0A852VGG8_9BACT|nr:hypothetical protein [Edaphobacter lichenicola]NYF90311.1 hypothetical protein [Edaphobacter lichenicola]